MFTFCHQTDSSSCCYTYAVTAIVFIVIAILLVVALIIVWCCCCCKRGPPAAIPLAAAMEMQSTAGGRRTLNILIVGETSVGKSTWINGFVNYFRYPLLADALAGPADEDLIPASFLVRDARGQNRRVEYHGRGHPNRNEVFPSKPPSPRTSVTQLPMTYLVQTNHAVDLRLIDTPGLGDELGEDHDRRNVQYILEHLGNVNELHAIVVLLPPDDDERLELVFKVCVTPLLDQLHRSVARNVIVCYTNGRSAAYKPAGAPAHPSLIRLMEKPPWTTDVGQPNDDRTYCVDGEGIRYLLAARSGVALADESKAKAEESWNKSATEMTRFLRFVLTLPPHPTRNCQTPNCVRNVVLSSIRPLAEIRQAVVEDMKKIASESDRLTDSKTSALARLDDQKLRIPSTDVDATVCPAPRVVCISPRCAIADVASASSPPSTFSTASVICCSGCHVPIGADRVHCDAVRHCAAISSTGPNAACRRCGGPVVEHVRLTYDTRRTTVWNADDLDQSARRAMRSRRDEYSAAAALVTVEVELRKRLDGLKRERHELDRALAVCAAYIKRRSVHSCDDQAIERCIAWLAERGPDAADTKVEGGDGVHDDDGQPEKVLELLVQLYQLPKTGPVFNKLMVVVDAGRHRSIECCEIVLEASSSARSAVATV